MGFRFILFIIALFAVWLIFRHLLSSRKPDAPTTTARPAPRKVITANIVECQHCGLHLPEDEAIMRHGKHFCSEQHADAHDQAG